MSDNKVVSMAEKANNSSMQTPEQVLNQCLDLIGKQGALRDGKKKIMPIPTMFPV